MSLLHLGQLYHGVFVSFERRLRVSCASQLKCGEGDGASLPVWVVPEHNSLQQYHTKLIALQPDRILLTIRWHYSCLTFKTRTLLSPGQQQGAVVTLRSVLTGVLR